MLEPAQHPEGTVRLRPGRDKPATLHHPWVFSGAVAAVRGEPAPGSLVRVEDHAGGFVARGHYNPAAQIRVRLLEWREEVAVDGAWFRRRIDEAVQRRAPLLASPDVPCRLVFSEADLLPGLIVDRYNRCLAVQILTAGMEALRPLILEHLGRLLGPEAIVDRSDAGHRALEGLPPAAGLAAGTAPGAPLVVREGAYAFTVDPGGGQKTGFYIDQRLNRPAVAAWAAGRRVLDAFCYTGAFSVHAAGAGAASLLLLDSSADALRAAEDNLRRNGLDGCPREVVCGNAFEELRRFRDAGRRFELIVLDPPRLAPTRGQVPKASRAYKDLNLLAMKLLVPEGILATFSCSGGVTPEHFREILSWAAQDAGREVQLLESLSQPADHPVRLSFPESAYLKGLVCRVL
jgi:23S rRNA (cytosine1962-C5)-methyltransferase